MRYTNTTPRLARRRRRAAEQTQLGTTRAEYIGTYLLGRAENDDEEAMRLNREFTAESYARLVDSSGVKWGGGPAWRALYGSRFYDNGEEVMRCFMFETQCAWNGAWDWVVVEAATLEEARAKAYASVDWEGGCPPAFVREV